MAALDGITWHTNHAKKLCVVICMVYKTLSLVLAGDNDIPVSYWAHTLSV